MKTVFLFFILIFSVCSHAADIRKNKVAKSEGLTDIVVSGELNADLSSEYFGYFDLTLENKSDRWLTISRVKVSFPDSIQGDYIRFVTGNDFLRWREAMMKSISLDEANKKTAMAVVGALGYGLASLSGNRALQVAGTAATVGAAGGYFADKYSSWQDSLERAKMFPENHLLADTLRLLPGLFADRWLLLNSRSHNKMGYVSRMRIDLETVEGEKGSYLLEFRSKSDWSFNWQRTFGPKAPCPVSTGVPYGSGC